MDSLVKIIITFFNSIPPIKKYKLQKINMHLEPVDLKEILDLNNEIVMHEYTRELTNCKNNVYLEAYENFRKTIEKKFDAEYLHNFYYNSEWVKANKMRFNIFRLKSGTYDCNKNKIRFRKDSLNHEFFHMCSTNYDSSYVTCGFSLDLDKKSIGDGINEGYTDLLTARYFNEDISNSYLIESKFAANLERIIGRETMEKLYMNGDFIGFIKCLTQFYTIDEIEKFLLEFDIVSLYSDEYLSEDGENKINSLVENCICFLIKGYSKVLANSRLSSELIKERIEMYFYDMKVSHSFYSNEYIFDMNRINQIIEENLGKYAIIDVKEEEISKVR